MAAMSKFLGLPTEIRLIIYENLLVHHGGYIMACSYVESTYQQPPLGLWPAILRVNKQVHGEASEVLYGNNRFQFLHHDEGGEVMDDEPGYPRFIIAPASKVMTRFSPDIAPFLNQIGHHASFLGHISIQFPILETYDVLGYPLRPYTGDKLKPYKHVAETLRLIRDNCTNTKTLELVISEATHAQKSGNYLRFLDNWSGNVFIKKAYPYHWDYLDGLFKEIVSLNEVLVHFQFMENQKEYFQEVKWQNQIKMWRERGWKCRFTNLGKTEPDVREGLARCIRSRAFDAWETYNVAAMIQRMLRLEKYNSPSPASRISYLLFTGTSANIYHLH